MGGTPVVVSVMDEELKTMKFGMKQTLVALTVCGLLATPLQAELQEPSRTASKPEKTNTALQWGDILVGAIGGYMLGLAAGLTMIAIGEKRVTVSGRALESR